MALHVFDVQRFSADDGPGIRTTFFLKGCNLRCLWCHNPEGIAPERQILFLEARCVRCGACAAACPHAAHALDAAGNHRFLRERCTACSACVGVCPAEALVRKGRPMSTEEVAAEALQDEAFYRASGGGVTFSGGEPLLQADALAEALSCCEKAGLHTAVDTAGLVDWRAFETVLPHTRLFLFDFKALSEPLHRRLTGRGNAMILENLRRLSGCGRTLWVRIPLIKGMNLRDAHDGQWRRMLDWLAGLDRLDRLDILPYHRLGESKYASLGAAAYTDVRQLFSREELSALLFDARARGLPAHCAYVPETAGEPYKE